MRYCFFLIIIVLGFGVFGADDKAPALTKVTFSPQWVPQAQFAGYYVAKDTGIYEKYGLDVEIVHRPAYARVVDILKERKALFITDFLSNAIINRTQGVKLVNIAQISQCSAMVLVARKSSDIKELEDIAGKKVGIFRDFFAAPSVFLKRNKIDAKKIPVVTGTDLFLLGGLDVITVMWYNEYHTLINSGLNEDELVSFFFKDFDFNVPEDGIYCMEDTYNKDPELCAKFAKASIEGWKAAFKNPDATIKIVGKYMRREHQPFNLAHQQWMLDKMHKLIFPDNSKTTGILSDKEYKSTVLFLKEADEIKTAPEYDDFYRNVFTKDGKK